MNRNNQEEDPRLKNFKPDILPSNMSTSNPICPQCGIAHPPIKQGEECPIIRSRKASPEMRELETIMMKAKENKKLLNMLRKTYKYWLKHEGE